MSILWVLLIMLVLVANPSSGYMITKQGCSETCENSDVLIPFPFGIGINCYQDSSYEIVCKPSNSNSSGAFKPFLRKLNIQVIRIGFYFDSYSNHYNISQFGTYNALEIATSRQEICTSAKGNSSNKSGNMEHDRNPFSFSSNTQFLVEGCSGHINIRNRYGDLIGGCSSVCQEDDTNASAANYNTSDTCNGLGCCLINIRNTQDSFNYYEIELSHLSNESVAHNNNTCMNVTLMDTSTESPFHAIWHWEPPGVSGVNHLRYDCTYDVGCSCKNGYKGNPYLPYGCQVVSMNDVAHSSKKKAMITGLGISLGSTIFLICCFSLFHAIRRWTQIKQKSKNYKRNGGLLLQQQVTTGDNAVDRTKVFSVDELEKATDSFNANRILGRGGQGTVYKGMLLDGRVVAIKKSLKMDESQIVHFINEVVILSQISHRNIVRLLGCCLETEVPLLVYEFIPNGTLGQHIHNPSEDLYITWKMRLQIASETSGALAYLHSASAIPIYHRDVKSSNILLDEKYQAKVADFGTSRTVMIDQTHLPTLIQGTFGYLDPEYFQTNQFTEKSDVYSFGVVLVELLTGQKPLSSAQSGGWKSLTMDFLLHMEISHLFDIIDSRILDEAKKEELLGMANLAKRCLNLNGKQRPTMKQVANVLDMITSSTMPSNVIYDIDVSNRTIEMGKMHERDVAMSTFCSENVIGASSSTEFKPLMHDTV